MGRQPNARFAVTANGLTAHILEYLTLRGVLCWRNNTGAYAVEALGSRRRFIRFGVRGSGDILAVLPGGRFLSIEVKVGRDELRDSQRLWMGSVRAAGGLAIVARCLEDVEQAIEGGRSDQ